MVIIHFNLRYGLGSIGRVGSVMLTLCVTVENYITVCKPFNKVRFQRFFAPCGILFAICYNIPKFFEFEVVYISNDETNLDDANDETEEPLDDVTNSTIGNSTVETIGRPIWSPTSLKNNWWYAKIYFFAIRFLFIEIIPYCIMSKFRILFVSIFSPETIFLAFQLDSIGRSGTTSKESLMIPTTLKKVDYEID